MRKQNQKHFFYVIKCQDNTFYAGYAVDVTRRVKEHNDGIGAKYTRSLMRRPVELIHYEVFFTRSDAMKQEYAFKQLRRKEKENYLAFMKTMVNIKNEQCILT